MEFFSTVISCFSFRHKNENPIASIQTDKIIIFLLLSIGDGWASYILYSEKLKLIHIADDKIKFSSEHFVILLPVSIRHSYKLATNFYQHSDDLNILNLCDEPFGLVPILILLRQMVIVSAGSCTISLKHLASSISKSQSADVEALGE